MRNLIISAMLSLFLLFPMTINADMVLNDTTTAAGSKTGFTVSKNVTITYAVNNPSGSTLVGVGFTAISSHLQGDALYGSGSDTTLVFKNTVDKDKGTAHTLTDGPSSDNATAAFGAPLGTGNWSPM